MTRTTVWVRLVDAAFYFVDPMESIVRLVHLVVARGSKKGLRSLPRCPRGSHGFARRSNLIQYAGKNFQSEILERKPEKGEIGHFMIRLQSSSICKRQTSFLQVWGWM
jgi:hypothetical protein